MEVEAYSYDPESETSLAQYDELKSWEPDLFPPGPYLPKLGVIVRDKDGQALTFLCADMSNSIPRAMIDHLQTNPAVPPRKRWTATVLAERFLCDSLARLGYVKVIGLSIHPGVASLSHEMDYDLHQKPVFVFAKNLT